MPLTQRHEERSAMVGRRCSAASRPVEGNISTSWHGACCPCKFQVPDLRSVSCRRRFCIKTRGKKECIDHKYKHIAETSVHVLREPRVVVLQPRREMQAISRCLQQGNAFEAFSKEKFPIVATTEAMKTKGRFFVP